MDLNAFNLKDLQTFSALSQYFESNGVTDVRFIRERISKHIQSNDKVRKAREIKNVIATPRNEKRLARKEHHFMKQEHKCPECGRKLAFSRIDEKSFLLVCTNRKKGDDHIGCQWSKLVEI